MAVSRPTVEGGTRLVFDSVQGMTRVVEDMHQTIAAVEDVYGLTPAKN